MNTNKKLIASLIIFSNILINMPSLFGALKPGQLLSVQDVNKTIEWRLNFLQQCLHDEIDNPTVKHKGWGGGDITHDYVMAQIITATGNLLTPMTPTGRAEPEKKTVEYVKQLLATETLSEAIDVWKIVLGRCKDATMTLDLIELVKESGRPFVRNEAVHGLRVIGDIAVIPDFLLLLSDEESYKSNEASCINDSPSNYPVRRAAFIALKRLGVDINRDEDLGGTLQFQYQVNTNSAVQILEKGLANVSDGRKENLLVAISKVGGEHAQKSLENFVEKNKTEPAKDELVLKAKKLLSELKLKQQ